MELNAYLALMVDQGGSDMFFSVGARPEIKVEGRTLPVGKEPMSSADLVDLATQCLDEAQRAVFAEQLELNTGLSVPGVGRFRLYLFRQRGEIAIVVRHVHDRIPGIDGKRAAAVEIMRNTPHISDLIEKGRIPDIQEIMAKHTEKGVQTFDESVFDLWQQGRISPRDAVRYADSQHEVRMRIEFAKPGTFSSIDPSELSIQDG